MPDFDITIKTPTELAGVEEGAGELERAIGKAKALGRNFVRLERQLERAREGMRRFRQAHPEAGAREMQNAECRMQNENGEGEGSCAGPPSLRSGAASGGEQGLESGSKLPLSKIVEAAEEGGRAGTGDSDEVAKGGGLDERPSPSLIPMDRGCAGGDGSSQGSTEPRPTEVDRETLEPRREVGGAGMTARREIEEIAREVVQEHDRAQPRRGNNQEEDRLAAMEARLRRLEERGRINRDGGG